MTTPVAAHDDQEIIDRILSQLQAETGHDFSHYKASTLLRRVGRRMAVRDLTALADYLTCLQSDPTEAAALLRECLIGVTEFFRDPEMFAALARTVLPQLLLGKQSSEAVRVWVVGCATGEEAYSIAILLSEATAGLTVESPIQVFATDIDEENLAFARRGLYPHTIAEQVHPERLQRFFVEEKEGYRVKADLREKVLFAVHNLLRDPPFSNLDLICCRNVLIYFEREAQEKSFEIFHYALRSEGYLFLGTSESADGATTLFVGVEPSSDEWVDKHHHLYQRRAGSSRPRRLPAEAVMGGTAKSALPPLPPVTPKPRSVQELYQAWTLRRYAPPRLLVNEQYDIIQVFNGAGRYLLEPDGVVTQNILQKIIPGLRLDLRAALYQAFSKGERTDSRLLPVEVNGELCFIQLHVGPVEEADFPKEYIEVVFEERKEEIVIGTTNWQMTSSAAESELVARLEEELQRTRERMQTILGEHESSIQELRAANEELQSVNEELKSTGEDLETSKEELQSMNEELATLNGELKLKIDELSRVNSDLLNFMASTNVGVVFLDPLLQVKRFTPPATELFHLIPGDVGRPFAHITHRIRNGAASTPPLELAQQVYETLAQIEEVVQGDNQRWYILRLFPYRTLDNAVDGVVITMIDITDWQRAEHEVQQRRQQQAVADLGRQALAGSDPTALVATATEQLTGLLGGEFVGVFAQQPNGDLLLQAGAGWQAEHVGRAVANADQNFSIWSTLRLDQPVLLGEQAAESNFYASPLLTEHKILSGMSVTIGSRTHPYGVLGIYSSNARHFTEYEVNCLQAVAHVLGEALQRQAAEAALRESEARFRTLMQATNQIVWITNAQGTEGTVLGWWEELTGQPAAEAEGWGYLTMIHPDDRTLARQAWKTALTTQRPLDAEYRVQIRDGTYRWFRVRGVPHLRADGSLHEWVGTMSDIHARKQSEEALRSAEERLRIAKEATKLGIHDYDPLTGRLEWDERLRQIWAISATTPVDYNVFLQGLHPDDRAATEAAVARALDPAGGGEFYAEYRVIGIGDGVERHVAATGQVFFADGKAIRLVGTVLDISERKRAEQALRTSEARLRAVQEATPDGYMIFESIRDEQGTIIDFRWLYTNPAGETLVGRTHADLLGKRLLEEMPGNRAEELFDAYVTVVESGQVWQREFSYRHEGIDRWFRSTAAKAEDGFAVAFSDITRRKAAEEALRASEEQSRRQLEEIEAIYATAPVGLCLVDTELRYRRINQMLATMNRLSVAEQIGRTLRETMAEEGFALVAPLYLHVIATGEPLLNQEVNEEYLHPAEARNWLASYYPLKDADGVVTGVNAVIQEITERKRQERELQVLNSQLEQRVQARTAELQRSNRELEQFNYAAAHDLRSPLRGIQQLVHWITQDLDDTLPPDSKRHLQQLRQRVYRLERLLDDMLAYSRAGRVQYALEEVDLTVLVGTIFEMLSPPAGFALHLVEPLPSLVTARVPLEMVLRNLFSNAIKHHHRPTEGSITVRVQELGAWIECCVTDNGPGIDPRFHGRIFDMFQTLRPRDEVEGSGIGLALVKRIVESYSGRVTLSSAEGQGATFCFTWPK
jgi:PAS domain S-box-containing protein